MKISANIIVGGVAALDAKELECGIIIGEKFPVPVLDAIVCVVDRISYFKSSVTTKSKFHITLGHQTVMAHFSSKCVSNQQTTNAVCSLLFGCSLFSVNVAAYCSAVLFKFVVVAAAAVVVVVVDAVVVVVVVLSCWPPPLVAVVVIFCFFVIRRNSCCFVLLNSVIVICCFIFAFTT